MSHRIARLKCTPESMWLVAEYLAEKPPFAGFEFAYLWKILRHQLGAAAHLVAMNESALVGYLGWMETGRTIAEDWLRDGGRLVPAAPGTADAVALTVFAADSPAIVRQLIQRGRLLHPNRPVYFKRSYPGCAAKDRKSHVRNLVAEGEMVSSG